MASSPSTMYIGIAVVVLLILGLGLGYWFWSKSDTSSKSTSPSSKRSSPSSPVTPGSNTGSQPPLHRLSGTEMKNLFRDMGHTGPIRVFGPNAVLTTDHVPTRLNIMTERDDPSTAVVSVSYG